MTVVELLRAGRKAEALSAAWDSVREHQSAKAFAELAHAELSHKDYLAAYHAAERAVKAEPSEPAYHFLWSRTATAAQQFERAIQEAKTTRVLSRELQSDYYVQSAALLAAWGSAQLGLADDARRELSQVSDNVKVMADRLLSPSLVEQRLAQWDQPGNSTFSMGA